MWGNRLGWAISSVIVVAVVGLMYLLVQFDTVSPSTAFTARPGVLDELRLPADPLTVLPAMTADEDAAPAYRRAIDAYRGNRTLYETFPGTGPKSKYNPADLRAVSALLEGTRAKHMRLFADDPAEVILYDSVENPVAYLKTIGKAALHLALLEQRNDRPQEALRLAEGVFSAGVKLFNERVTYLELQAGMEMMSGGAGMIEKISRDSLKDAARADAAKAFADALRDYQTGTLDPIARALTSIDPKVVRQHAGDVFAFAEQSKEKMWRNEAILKLGRMRYFVGTNGRVGDQKGAMRKVRRYAESPDKATRAAGTKARDLTLAEYNSMR